MPERSKLLIVDDRPENLFALEEVLIEADVEIIKAANGNEALKATLHHEFALMILDVNMPGMDGFELAGILRNNDDTKNIPIIFVTGVYKEYDSLFKGYRTGAVDYIVKPIDADMLLSKVRVFVQLDRRNRELQESNRRLREEIAERGRAERKIRKMAETLRQANREARSRARDLGERVKELNCLYGISHLIQEPGVSLEEIFQGAVNIIPPSWQYPEIARARIVMGDREFCAGKFKETEWKQTASITPRGEPAGVLEVCYLEERPESDEGPFLREERKLIDAVAEQLSRITEYKHAEAELRRTKDEAEAASRAKSAFLTNMSHELRTPLNAILGFSQLLARGENLDSEQKANLNTIRRGGEHLLTLINQVLDLSKIEAGGATLVEMDFDLYNLLDEVEDMFRLQADKKGLELLFERAPDAPRRVRADMVKLRQVLINLLGNSIKFTRGGRISVSVRVVPAAPVATDDAPPADSPPRAGVRTGIDMSQRVASSKKGQPQGIAPTSTTSTSTTTTLATSAETMTETATVLSFSISDTGPGIAPEELTDLFEAFVQTRSGRESHKGTGLGLAISRKFVELMGGGMNVESEVGRGTTFAFHIRVGAADAVDHESVEPSRKVIALEPNQPRRRILIVDDREDNRRLLVHLLNPLGFELREAENGLEAIEAWKSWRPHLIWMDIRMPVMDGDEATKRIRRSESRVLDENDSRPPSCARIIALTAGDPGEERGSMAASGFDDFLRKPFYETDVFGLMAKHLDVRFVYEGRVESDAARSGEPDDDAPDPAELRALPQELLEKFMFAVERTDPKGSIEVIERIRSHDAPLADALAALVGAYRFDIIQAHLEEN